MEGDMEFLTKLGNSLADGRLGVHLIAAHGLITITVILSLLLRRLVMSGSSQLAQSTGLGWVGAASEHAAQRIRSLLIWATFVTLVAIIASTVGYHRTGRDIRHDLSAWFSNFTVAELVQISLRVSAILGVLFSFWLFSRLMSRFWPVLESMALAQLPVSANRPSIDHWFTLLKWYVQISFRILGLWLIGISVGLPGLSRHLCSFSLKALSVLFIARLLTLAWRILSKVVADGGTRYLGVGRFRPYWERAHTLLPLGERCFEAAVYVTAAGYIAELLSVFGPNVWKYGSACVECIGIFFVTRVLVELVQVLFHEAFGLNDESRPANQKALTLVPLLCSVSEYSLYFGAGIAMLNTVPGLEKLVMPVLTGVGILGLAVGLGAQSLVTDIVSGFFILFENQYLVGDYVKIGDADGVVEAVGIRVTQVRDVYGKLFIIPNGQIKGVVSYSKGFVNAVVDWKVPAGSNLEEVFRSMAEAGRRLRQARREILSDTLIHGIVDLGSSDMTIRAVTKVRPGTHGAMQSEYRRLLKQVLDQNPIPSTPRPQAA
jgi:small conductance mechanosensitive channel